MDGPPTLNEPTSSSVDSGMHTANSARRPIRSASRPPAIKPSDAGVAVLKVNRAMPPPV